MANTTIPVTKITITGNGGSSVGVEHSIIAALSGTGDLAAVLDVISSFVALTAALSGTGALTATAQTATPITSAQTGVGAATAVAAVSISITAALTGTGDLAAGVQVGSPITAALSGTGDASAAIVIQIPIISALSGTGSLAAALGTEAGTVEVALIAALSGTGDLSATLDITVAPTLNVGGSDGWAWQQARRPSKPLVKSGGVIHITIPIRLTAAQPEVLIPVSGSTGITFESWITARALVILDIRGSRAFSSVFPSMWETRTLCLPSPVVYTRVSAATYEALLTQNRALSRELMREREAMAQELEKARADIEALAILALSEVP